MWVLSVCINDTTQRHNVVKANIFYFIPLFVIIENVVKHEYSLRRNLLSLVRRRVSDLFVSPSCGSRKYWERVGHLG